MNEITHFNIRVYGLLLNDKNEILLVHEKMNNNSFTKFPGGGLEFGEGIKDCLIREFKEEASIDIEVTQHFYTTDFFQQSAFRKTDQIISVYYRVKALSNTSTIRLDEFEITTQKRTEYLQFKWVPLTGLKESMLDLPIDQVVCRKMLSEKF